MPLSGGGYGAVGGHKLGGGSKGSGVPLHLGGYNSPAPTPAPQSTYAPPPMRGQTPPPQASMPQTSSPTSGSTPYGAAGESADTLQDYGTGLLDPNSPESQRWMEELREQIGRSTEADQRASGYMAAQSGFGGGSSPEVLEMQQNLGVAGREAEGQAASDFILRAPTLGVDALGRALGGQVGMRGQDLQARMAEMGMTQSGEQSNARMEMEQRNLDLERERMEQERYLRELMMEYGGY